MLFILWLVVRLLTRVLVLSGADEATKDLEILVLQQQLRVLRRTAGRPRFTPLDRVLLAAASRALPRRRCTSLFLVTPQTLLRWHRELVRHKWTYPNTRKPGRPPLDPEVVTLVLRMARENPRWGCGRISGELRKLGIRVGATTIRALLRRGGLGPAPRRGGPTWTQFLKAQAEAIVACDFSTVETIWLKTLYVLFFQLSTRQVTVAGVTARPDAAWVTQQARNAAMDLDDRQVATRFLLRDHDAKFTRGFDEVFDSEEGKVVRTPIRAPKANAHAERWVQTVRAECLDWTLVLGRRHLLRLLRAYVRHDNAQRPHRSLALATPEAREQSSRQVNPREVRRRDALGGLIHEYHEVAA
jgi:putative transposase